MSPNEARAFEDWNPYEGGDEFRIPLNLGPAGQEDPTVTASPPDTNANALAPLLSDAKQRIVARHEQNVERGRTRSDSLDFAIKVLTPIAETAQSLGIEINAEQTAAAIIDAIKNDVDVPAYVSENARRGLEYYEQGLGGDGLVEQTIRDARDMVAGTIRDAKVGLIGPWIARHLVDLDAPQNNDPEDPAYPGPGLVAMLLWGAGPDKEGARRTKPSN
jgi:hypothetical protein